MRVRHFPSPPDKGDLGGLFFAQNHRGRDAPPTDVCPCHKNHRGRAAPPTNVCPSHRCLPLPQEESGQGCPSHKCLPLPQMFAPSTDAGGALSRITYHASRITHHDSHLDHYIKKPLINQQHRANITEAQTRPRYKDQTTNKMQRTCLFFILLIIAALSIPSRAAAQYTLTKISGDGQTGFPGQTLQPFVVQISPVAEDVPVTFAPSHGPVSDLLVRTDANGRAQSTQTLGRRIGTATTTVSVSGDSVTFTATTIRPPPPPPPPRQRRLLIISGKNQTGLVGQPLAAPFAVRVRDHNSRPLGDVPVTFTVTAGGGTLNTTRTITDAKGRAMSTLTLGSEPGTNTVEVRAEGVDQTRSFSAEATLPPPIPTTLSIVSGNNQTGMIDEPLATPFGVEVRDQYNDPMPGATVTFSVTGGGGTLSNTTGLTDINGRAESVLTLGSQPGTNTVDASVEGVAQTETFTAEATLPPAIPTTLSSLTDPDPDGLTVETATDPLVVEVSDQYGDPVAGVPVTFTILGSDGSEPTITVTTDEGGRAEFTLPPGSDPGAYTITGSVAGIAETVAFSVRVPFEFELSLPVGISLIHIPLKVQSVDGVPMPIESLSDLYAALGGADTVVYLYTRDAVTQEWIGYFGDSDAGTRADRELTDDMGIVLFLISPTVVRLGGDALGRDGMSAITLSPGVNLIGLPLRDPRITRVSDLFALEGIAGNITAMIVADSGELKPINRPDDAEDIPVTGGGGFILIVQQEATIPITGTGWDNVP